MVPTRWPPRICQKWVRENLRMGPLINLNELPLTTAATVFLNDDVRPIILMTSLTPKIM